MSDKKKKGFEPLPEGEYLMRLVQCDIKDTKNGGKMASCRYEVAKGDHKKKLVFDNYVFQHEKDIVVEIARRSIDSYLKAVGEEDGLETLGEDFTQLEDYLELPFVAEIVHKEAKSYVNKNGETVPARIEAKIKSFKAR
jgi:hypothetical protein